MEIKLSVINLYESDMDRREQSNMPKKRVTRIETDLISRKMFCTSADHFLMLTKHRIKYLKSKFPTVLFK